MKNYVIIGGSSGVGKELVSILKEEEGVELFVTYNKNFVENERNVTYYKFDVGQDTFPLESFPTEIHGLVYCPGSINLKPFHRFEENDFISDFKLQVIGATRVIQDLLPRMKKAESSSIVLFSTIAVQKGFNFHSQVAMSKGAIEGLTRALAAEFAPKIRVNAIAPSLTDTPLATRLLSSPEKHEAQAQVNPMKRVGNPVEVAEAAMYLLTKKSSWVTGQILHVDGGASSLM